MKKLWTTGVCFGSHRDISVLGFNKQWLSLIVQMKIILQTRECFLLLSIPSLFLPPYIFGFLFLLWMKLWLGIGHQGNREMLYFCEQYETGTAAKSLLWISVFFCSFCQYLLKLLSVTAISFVTLELLLRNVWCVHMCVCVSHFINIYFSVWFISRFHEWTFGTLPFESGCW